MQNFLQSVINFGHSIADHLMDMLFFHHTPSDLNYSLHIYLVY